MVEREQEEGILFSCVGRAEQSLSGGMLILNSQSYSKEHALPLKYSTRVLYREKKTTEKVLL